MSRFLPTLLATLMVTVALAGCFSDDGGNDDDPEDTPTPTATNNTTPPPPPNKVPQPVYTLSIADDNSTYTEPYLIPPGGNVTFTFDASGSTDEDGNVTGYAWTITDPSGKESTNKEEVFVHTVEGMSGSFHYGVWTVELRAIDDDQDIGIVTDTFTVNYINIVAAPGFTGPGGAERGEPHDRLSSDPLVPGLPRTGTFDLQGATVGKNASSLQLTLEFTGDANMKLYLFDPSVTSAEATADAETVAEAESGASPVELTVDAATLSATGRYNIRCELDGNSIDEYTLTSVVMYGAAAGNNTTAE